MKKLRKIWYALVDSAPPLWAFVLLGVLAFLMLLVLFTSDARAAELPPDIPSVAVTAETPYETAYVVNMVDLDPVLYALQALSDTKHIQSVLAIWQVAVTGVVAGLVVATLVVIKTR